MVRDPVDETVTEEAESLGVQVSAAVPNAQRTTLMLKSALPTAP